MLNSLNKRGIDRYDYIVSNLSSPFADKISLILLEQGIADAYKDILILYADFLYEISKKGVRAHLDDLQKADRKKDELFLVMTKKARQFNDNLLDLLHVGEWGEKDYLDLLAL